MKYIDAEKLIAEIERRKDEWQALINKNNAVNPTAVKEVICEDLNILDIIASLQQELQESGSSEKPNNPAEWSEEDIQYSSYISAFLQSNCGENEVLKQAIIWFMTRLKSLRPQPRWKPSEEQMKRFKNVLITDRGIWGIETKRAMESLYDDLKKL